jgi:hypothetical protein
LHILEGFGRGDQYNLHQSILPLSEGNPLDLRIMESLVYLSNSSIAFVALVGFEREGFDHNLGVLALHPCIVLICSLRFVRVRDRELVTLEG